MADIYARHVANARGDRFRLQAMAIDMPFKQFEQFAIGSPEQRAAKNEVDEQFDDHETAVEVEDGVWELELRHPVPVHRRSGEVELIETVRIKHPKVRDLSVRDTENPDQMRRIMARLTGLRLGQIDDLRVGDFMEILDLITQMIVDTQRD